MSNEIKKEMITMAREKWGKIYPCGGYPSFNSCFTYENDCIIFWFNTAIPGKRDTTHCITVHTEKGN